MKTPKIAIFEVSISKGKYKRIRNMVIDEVAVSKLGERLEHHRNSEAAQSKFHDIVFAPACFLPEDPNAWASWADRTPEEIFGDWTLDNYPSYAM